MGCGPSRSTKVSPAECPSPRDQPKPHSEDHVTVDCVSASYHDLSLGGSGFRKNVTAQCTQAGQACTAGDAPTLPCPGEDRTREPESIQCDDLNPINFPELSPTAYISATTSFADGASTQTIQDGHLCSKSVSGSSLIGVQSPQARCDGCNRSQFEGKSIDGSDVGDHAAKQLSPPRTTAFRPRNLTIKTGGMAETIFTYEERCEALAGRAVKINQYEIGRRLSGDVNVFTCTDTTCGDEFAIKSVTKSVLKRQRVGRFGNALESVMNEIDVWRRLDHPNIVRLVEVIDDAASDRLHMVMEQLPGSLFQASEVIGDVDCVRPLFAQLLQSVSYLHHNGFGHRDIKPDNIVVNVVSRRLKLADFSAAYEFPKVGAIADDRSRTAVGTAAYSAPEMCNGNTFSTCLADAWACGATLYFMLFGAPLWSAKTKTNTVTALYEIIRSAPVEFPEHTTTGQWGQAMLVLRAMLEKDPAKRMTVDEALQSPWLNCTCNLAAPIVMMTATPRECKTPSRASSLPPLSPMSRPPSTKSFADEHVESLPRLHPGSVRRHLPSKLRHRSEDHSLYVSSASERESSLLNLPSRPVSVVSSVCSEDEGSLEGLVLVRDATTGT